MAACFYAARTSGTVQKPAGTRYGFGAELTTTQAKPLDLAEEGFGYVVRRNEADRQAATARDGISAAPGGTGGGRGKEPSVIETVKDTLLRIGRETVSGVSSMASAAVNTLGMYLDHKKGFYDTMRKGTDGDRAPDFGMNNPLYPMADKLGDYAGTQHQRATEGASGIGKVALDVYGNAIPMAADAVVGMASGGASLIPLALRAFGSSAREARSAGADFEQASLYGAANAATEALTEKMFGDPLHIYGEGIADSAASGIRQKFGAKQLKTAAGRGVLKILSSMGEEAAEEAVAGLVEPGFKSIYNGKGVLKNYGADTFADMAYSSLIGGILGGLGGTISAVRGDVDASVKRTQDETAIRPGDADDGKTRLANAQSGVYNNSITNGEADHGGVQQGVYGSYEEVGGVLSREESKPAVERRNEGDSEWLHRMDESGATVERIGSFRVGYRPVPLERQSDYAKSVVNELAALGRKAVVYEGRLEANNGTMTRISNSDAVTLANGVVAVPNDGDMPPREVAGHETAHSLLDENAPTAFAFKDAVERGLNLGDSGALDYIATIVDGYLEDGLTNADIGEKTKAWNRVLRELTSYVSGHLYDGETEVLGMFHDPAAVGSAWQAMIDQARRTAGRTDGISTPPPDTEQYSVYDMPNTYLYSPYDTPYTDALLDMEYGDAPYTKALAKHDLLRGTAREVYDTPYTDALDAMARAQAEAEARVRAERTNGRQPQAFNKKADPLYEALGPIKESHPDEIKRIMNEAASIGVEVREGKGRMAYSPGLCVGLPGQLFVSENDSFGAWIHEEQHMLDDRNDGWAGFRGILNVDRRIEMEYNAYKKEVDLARAIGREDLAEQLIDAYYAEVKSFGGEPIDIK